MKVLFISDEDTQKDTAQMSNEEIRDLDLTDFLEQVQRADKVMYHSGDGRSVCLKHRWSDPTLFDKEPKN